jgi:hypothetical protein
LRRGRRHHSVSSILNPPILNPVGDRNVSLRKLLGSVLMAAALQIAVFSGVRMPPEEIEKLMNVMHRTQIVQVVKKDGP